MSYIYRGSQRITDRKRPKRRKRSPRAEKHALNRAFGPRAVVVPYMLRKLPELAEAELSYTGIGMTRAFTENA